MKRRSWIILLVLTSQVMLITGCGKDEEEVVPSTPPVVSTTEVSATTQTSATSGGNITSDGGESVSARGVCWSTSESPTITDSKTSDGTGTGSFTSNLSNLTSATTYHVRAYATNSVGTTYGSPKTFTTGEVQVPQLTTVNVTDITMTTAVSGGNITSDGGASVTARGICWSNTNENPTIADSKTSNGTGTGSFTSNLTGLTHSTTYHVRAYATNSAGTAYGNVQSFTTQGIQVPDVTTLEVTDIFPTAATSGYLINGNGGGTITEWGICWSTSETPDVDDNKLIKNAGAGNWQETWTFDVYGLAPSSTYYVRGYAINSQGVGYGEVKSFTTLAPITVTDVDGNVYTSVTINKKTWTIENLKTTKYNDGTDIPNITDQTAWDEATSGAYAWYDNDITYKTDYGALYNFYTVETDKLCPTGWHVPEHAEWTALKDYLGNNASGKLREEGTDHWVAPNTDATNETGFKGLPGGRREDNRFLPGFGNNAYFWSSTPITSGSNEYAWYSELRNNMGPLFITNFRIYYGHSVRCVKD